MKLQNSRCLILNANYTPMGIISWKKALVWSMKYQLDNSYDIEIIDFYQNDYIVGVNNKQIPIPSVAKTARYYRPNGSVNFSRKNIFIRDEYTCQYCGHNFIAKQLTYDHVIPKSRYRANFRNSTNWINIVTSCIKCNFKKGNRTPEEAKMKLLTKPYEPRYSDKYLPWYDEAIKIYQNYNVESWKPFLNLARTPS